MFGHATHVLESQFFRAFLALVLIVFAFLLSSKHWEVRCTNLVPTILIWVLKTQSSFEKKS